MWESKTTKGSSRAALGCLTRPLDGAVASCWFGFLEAPVLDLKSEGGKGGSEFFAQRTLLGRAPSLAGLVEAVAGAPSHLGLSAPPPL